MSLSAPEPAATDQPHEPRPLRRSPLVVAGIGAFGGSVVRRLGVWLSSRYPETVPVTRFLHVGAAAAPTADFPVEWWHRLETQDPGAATRELKRRAAEALGAAAVEAARDRGLGLAPAGERPRLVLLLVSDVAEADAAPLLAGLLRALAAELPEVADRAQVVALGAVGRAPEGDTPGRPECCPAEIAELLREPVGRSVLRYYVLDRQREDGFWLSAEDLEAATLRVAELIAAPSASGAVADCLLGDQPGAAATALATVGLSWVDAGQDQPGPVQAALGRALLENHPLAPVGSPDDLARRLRDLGLLQALPVAELAARLCAGLPFSVVAEEGAAPTLELAPSLVMGWADVLRQHAESPLAAPLARLEEAAQQDLVAPGVERLRTAAGPLAAELVAELEAHVQAVIREPGGPAVAAALLESAREILDQDLILEPSEPAPSVPESEVLQQGQEAPRLSHVLAGAAAATVGTVIAAWSLLGIAGVTERYWGMLAALVLAWAWGLAALLYVRARDRAAAAVPHVAAEGLALRCVFPVRQALLEALDEVRATAGAQIAEWRTKVSGVYDRLAALADELGRQAATPPEAPSALAVRLCQAPDGFALFDQQGLDVADLWRQLAQAGLLDHWPTATVEELRDRVTRFCVQQLPAPRPLPLADLLAPELAGTTGASPLLEGLLRRAQAFARPTVPLGSAAEGRALLVTPDDPRLLLAWQAAEAVAPPEIVAEPWDLVCLVRTWVGLPLPSAGSP